jgi:hypothetical protein
MTGLYTSVIRLAVTGGGDTSTGVFWWTDGTLVIKLGRLLVVQIEHIGN